MEGLTSGQGRWGFGDKACLRWVLRGPGTSGSRKRWKGGDAQLSPGVFFSFLGVVVGSCDPSKGCWGGVRVLTPGRRLGSDSGAPAPGGAGLGRGRGSRRAARALGSCGGRGSAWGRGSRRRDGSRGRGSRRTRPPRRTRRKCARTHGVPRARRRRVRGGAYLAGFVAGDCLGANAV